MLQGEKVAGENPVNVMEGETGVITLGLFNESGGISDVRPQSLLYLRERSLNKKETHALTITSTMATPPPTKEELGPG